MPRFNASTIEALEYDLTKYAGKVKGAKGEIPEPSEMQLEEFFAFMERESREARREMRREQELLDGLDETGEDFEDDEVEGIPDGNAESDSEELDREDPEELQAALDEAVKNRAKAIAATAKLCSGEPSEEVLDTLPMRPFRAFTVWLIRELSDPEGIGATGVSTQGADANGSSSGRSSASPSKKQRRSRGTRSAR